MALLLIDCLFIRTKKANYLNLEFGHWILAKYWSEKSFSSLLSHSLLSQTFLLNKLNSKPNAILSESQMKNIRVIRSEALLSCRDSNWEATLVCLFYEKVWSKFSARLIDAKNFSWNYSRRNCFTHIIERIIIIEIIFCVKSLSITKSVAKQ